MASDLPSESHTLSPINYISPQIDQISVTKRQLYVVNLTLLLLSASLFIPVIGSDNHGHSTIFGWQAAVFSAMTLVDLLFHLRVSSLADIFLPGGTVANILYCAAIITFNVGYSKRHVAIPRRLVRRTFLLATISTGLMVLIMPTFLLKLPQHLGPGYFMWTACPTIVAFISSRILWATPR